MVNWSLVNYSRKISKIVNHFCCIGVLNCGQGWIVSATPGYPEISGPGAIIIKPVPGCSKPSVSRATFHFICVCCMSPRPSPAAVTCPPGFQQGLLYVTLSGLLNVLRFWLLAPGSVRSAPCPHGLRFTSPGGCYMSPFQGC
jgi:hypothetical protein